MVEVVKSVNFICVRDLNHPQLVGVRHGLPYHPEVKWLSLGIVLKLVGVRHGLPYHPEVKWLCHCIVLKLVGVRHGLP